MKKHICLILYYGFGQYLPKSTSIIGKLWKTIRGVLAKGIFLKCGRNVNLENKAYFGTGKRISIGDNSGIGSKCELLGEVTIGKDVMMAPEVVIFTWNHKYDRTDIPMRLQGKGACRPVIIEDDVWIGQRAMIMPGVTLGKGCIIGAGSVVTKSVEPYSIVGGVPAIKLKNRD